MCKIGKYILAATLVIPAATKDPSQDILNKSLPEFSAWPGTEFETLCRVANIVCGEELADSKKVADAAEPLILTSTTVKGVLDAIVARNHEYKWTLSNGVVNLLPVDGYGMGSNGGLLSAAAMPVGPISEDLLKICRATGNGCVNAADEYLNINSAKLPRFYVATRTVTIVDGETLGQVLNMLVLRQCKHLWRIKPLGKGYGIDMVVWLGPNRTKLMGPKSKVAKAKAAKERAELAALYRRESEIKSAERILEEVARRKMRAEAPKIMEECRAEVEAFTKVPHTLEGFDKLAAKYKKKNPRAAFYVREVALSKVTPDEAEQLSLEILAEADEPGFTYVLAYEAVERLWALEVDRGNYAKAMSIYRDGVKKYGCNLICGSCDWAVDGKERYITELWSAENEIKTVFKSVFAAEAKGNKEEVFGYFASDSLAQWYVERFKNRRKREFVSAVIKVDQLRSGKVTVRERFIDLKGKREIGQFDCNVLKIADHWKISNVIPDDKFLNRSVSEIYALPGTEFETLCRIAGLRCGEELAAPPKMTVVKETLALTSTTVKEVLNAIVVRYPEYRWTVANGVVNLLPVGGAGMGVNGGAVSAVVMLMDGGGQTAGKGGADVTKSEWQISGDMMQICKYLGRECVAAGVQYVDSDSSRLPDVSGNANPITVRSGETLWQVLNKVVLRQPKNMWRISPEDSKSYAIDAVVWPAHRIPKAMRVLARAEKHAKAAKEAAQQRLKLEQEAEIAEDLEKSAVAEKAMAEERKIMDKCRGEVEALKKKPHSVADFDKLAAKYKNKNRAAELYVLMEATSEVSPEEEARRCRELLVEAGDPKSSDPVIVLRLLDRLWTLETNKGNYDGALMEYRERMKKYACSFLGELCDELVRDKERDVADMRTRASKNNARFNAELIMKAELGKMLKQLLAAEAEGNEKAVISYFAQPPKVKMQEYQQNLKKFKGIPKKDFQKTEINVWADNSGQIRLFVGDIQAGVNRDVDSFDWKLEKIDGQWKIVFIW